MLLTYNSNKLFRTIKLRWVAMWFNQPVSSPNATTASAKISAVRIKPGSVFCLRVTSLSANEWNEVVMSRAKLLSSQLLAPSLSWLTERLGKHFERPKAYGHSMTLGLRLTHIHILLSLSLSHTHTHYSHTTTRTNGCRRPQSENGNTWGA